MCNCHANCAVGVDQFCSDPGSITNGFYVCKPNNCDNFREGTEVHFMCSTGYVIEPAELAVQTCESGGYWTGSALALYCSPGKSMCVTLRSV